MGVDRLLDMLRTSLNVAGDATVTLIINKVRKIMNWFEVEIEIDFLENQLN